MSIVWIFAGILITLVGLYFIAPRVMFLENESRYSFDETNAIVEKRAAEMKWNIPNQYDLQATMKKNGFEVNPVRIFSLCKPGVAFKILSGNQERIASSLMPCRISVYQRENGKTYVSRLNAGLFSTFLGKTIRQAMKEAAVETEQLLEPVLKK